MNTLTEKVREFAALGATYAGIVRLKGGNSPIKGGHYVSFTLEDKAEDGTPLFSLNPFKGFHADNVKGQRFVMVAVALPDEEPKKQRSWHELSLPEQAGILSNKPEFQKWVGDKDAVEFIRERCGVKTRADIKEGTAAGRAFMQMVAKYLNETGVE